MTVTEIIKKYLKDNGYDGLWNPGICYCTIEDFMPCEDPDLMCAAGYKVKCNQECNNEEPCISSDGKRDKDTCLYCEKDK